MRIHRAVAAAAVVALALPAVACAHAVVSPPVAKAKTSQLFTLSVSTEREGATTASVELTPPSGFNIDSFQPSPGWKRTVSTGSGESAAVTKVTWSGGRVPTEEDAVFGFTASTSGAKTYTFKVRQTYSSGEVVDWTGPESSDTPSPTIEAKDSLGGAGSSSTLGIIALAVGGVALVLSVVALLAGGGGGRRALA